MVTPLRRFSRKRVAGNVAWCYFLRRHRQYIQLGLQKFPGTNLEIPLIRIHLSSTSLISALLLV
jgi:hypothetical protein